MADFYNRFIAQRDEIESKLRSASSEADKQECLRQISDLSSQCKAVLHTLPHHDQQLYNEQLAALTKKATEGRKKFAFKSRMGSFQTQTQGQTGTSQTQSQTSQTSQGDGRSQTQWQSSHGNEHSQTQSQMSTSSSSQTQESSQSSCSNLHETVHKSHGGPVAISNCYRSVLIIDSTTAKLDNISKCFVYITGEGPVYLTNVKDSILAINCHQFRMHSSNDTQVYISCKSRRPIIEKCSGIGFGQFPSQLAEGKDVYEWEAIDDFNWLRPSQSPHWSQITQPTLDWDYMVTLIHHHEQKITPWLNYLQSHSHHQSM
uniref:ARAD1C08822p n=1 Tax=Blastobotrys adeninivorans TaxID=409370 RepID=A0A060T541_BLAAD